MCGRYVKMEIVNAEAMKKSPNMKVHILHFKTHTVENPPYTLTAASAADVEKWGSQYELTTPEVLRHVCGEVSWGCSAIINITMMEAHADAGIHDDIVCYF